MSASNLTDGGLLLQCAINSTIDPSCSCLMSGGGPQLNTDISGPGVRISFYLQALFLALLTSLCKEADNVANALYTLVVTNIAMVVASLILGFQKDPQMSFHDAIVVLYLLTISWTSTFFSLPNGTRYYIPAFGIVYIIQSYTTFAFVLSVLITAKTFGSTWRCNSHAVVVIFRPFPALNAGRILAFVFLAIVFLIYTVLTIFDYGLNEPSRYAEFGRWVLQKMRKTEDRQDDNPTEEIETDGVRQAREGQFPQGAERGTYMPAMFGLRQGRNRDEDLYRPWNPRGKHILQVVIIVIVWAIFVANTELMIVKNYFNGGGDGLGPSLWSFGQILSMLLVLLPLMNLTKVVTELCRTKGQTTKPIHRIRIHANVLLAPNSQTGGRRHERSHANWRSPPRTSRSTPYSQWTPPFFPYAGTGRMRRTGSQASARISMNSIPTSTGPMSDTMKEVANATSRMRTEHVPDTREDVNTRRDFEGAHPRHSASSLTSVSSYATAGGDNA